MITQILNGSVLEQNVLPNITRNAVVKFNGEYRGTQNARFCLSKSILSKHIMLLGGTGCGKTNTFFHMIKQIKENITSDDVAIIFDTKGDYYEKFFDKTKDYVISSSPQHEQFSSKWNVFNEILSDGYNDSKINLNSIEIAWGLFAEAIERNSSNPFFPNAARDLFSSILTCIVRCTEGKKSVINEELHNFMLRGKVDTMNAKSVQSLLGEYPDQTAVLSYIGDGNNPQGLGVWAELQTIVRQIFTGGFAEIGDFSIKDFVEKRGGRTLFIEYDLAIGSSLTPIYKLLIDLALKQAMSMKGHLQGNVYIFCDEFKLLPHLKHIEDAVNFGRSLGVKVFAGLQSVDQLIENYGESRGKNILAGFSSVFAFKANDASTRQFVSDLYGKNYISEQFLSNNTIIEEKRFGNVVEDWDLCGLQVGEAVVGLPNEKPFKFKFELFNNRR